VVNLLASLVDQRQQRERAPFRGPVSRAAAVVAIGQPSQRMVYCSPLCSTLIE
jgi:hypothetical protein